MKAKLYSWLLASAYLAWGVCLFLFIPKFQQLFLGFGFSTPFLVRVMFVAGPYGCLLMTAIIGTFITLNAGRFHRRYMSLIWTFALLVWVVYVAEVLSTSFMRNTPNTAWGQSWAVEVL